MSTGLQWMLTLSCLAEETPKNLRSKDLSDAKLRASVFGQRRIRQASDLAMVRLRLTGEASVVLGPGR